MRLYILSMLNILSCKYMSRLQYTRFNSCVATSGMLLRWGLLNWLQGNSPQIQLAVGRSSSRSLCLTIARYRSQFLDGCNAVLNLHLPLARFRIDPFRNTFTQAQRRLWVAEKKDFYATGIKFGIDVNFCEFVRPMKLV